MDISKSDLYLRSATNEDIEEFGNIIDRAFHKKGFSGSGPSVAKAVDSLEDVRLVILKTSEGEKIIGACPIKAYPFHFGPNIMKSGGLSVVGVDPDYQRMGIGQMLLKDAEEYMFRENYDVCLLKTGSPDFYRHNGWEMGVDTYLYEIETNNIEDSIFEKYISKFDNYEIGEFSSEYLKDISILYENFQENFAMTRIRDEKYWKSRYSRKASEFDSLYCIKKKDELIGYFWIKRRYPGKHSGFMSSKKERIALVDYALLKNINNKENDILNDLIIKTIKRIAKDEEFEYIHLEIPDNYPLVKRFIEIGAKDNTYWWSALMVLIVNIKSFLRKLKTYQESLLLPKLNNDTLSKLGNFEINLECNGEIIQYLGSNGNIEINLNPIQCSEKIIEISRKNLGVMVLANFTPTALVESEYWNCPEELLNILDLIFPPLKTYITEGDGF